MDKINARFIPKVKVSTANIAKPICDNHNDYTVPILKGQEQRDSQKVS